MDALLIGLNHRTAAVELRERIAFTAAESREAAGQLRARGILKEALVLSTCNRSEVYDVATHPGGDTLGAVEQFMGSYHSLQPEKLNEACYRLRGRDTVQHLFRVTSGLDSMLLGEAEILGQVRESYRIALEAGTTGSVLNRLFQSALEVGKRVRAETGISTRPVSVAFAGVKLAEQIFGNLDQHCALILGAGATSERVVRHLCDRGIRHLRVMNRTLEKAKNLAARFGGAAEPWENLAASLTWPDLIVTSVSTRNVVLTRGALEQAMLARGNRPFLVIDLGVPRNVAADAASLYNLYLYDIDGLSKIVEQNKIARKDEIPKAEAIVDAQILKFMHWHAGAAAYSVYAELAARPPAERSVFVREHLASMSHLSEKDRNRITGLVDTFFESVPHDSQDFQQGLPELLRNIHES